MLTIAEMALMKGALAWERFVLTKVGPGLKTFGNYAKVELTPPGPGDWRPGEGRRGLGGGRPHLQVGHLHRGPGRSQRCGRHGDRLLVLHRGVHRSVRDQSLVLGLKIRGWGTITF